MPHSIATPATSSPRGEVSATGCAHQFVRIEKWSESTLTEDRVTDDFGRKSGRLRHHRMTTTYEKYRCQVCGEEDVQAYTIWEER